MWAGKLSQLRTGASLLAPITLSILAGSKLGSALMNQGSGWRSFFTPRGKMGTMHSLTHFSVSSGLIFRWVGHSDSTSTKE